MTTDQKHEITEAIKRKLADKNMSQNAAAKAAEASGATISAILNGIWENVSDKMWMKLSAWADHNPGWTIVETLPNYTRIQRVCEHTKRHSVSKCIIGDPGKGKSESLRSYARSHPDTIYIQCAEFWTKKYFLNVLAHELGVTEGGLGIPEKVEAIVNNIRTRQSPLIIIDEADKMKDGVLNLYLALFNETTYRCGIVLVGASYLADRINKGRRLNKQSYKEIFSRIGGEYVQLRDLKPGDIVAICNANGLFAEELVNEVVNIAADDIRRIKNKIEDLLRTNKVANSKAA